MRSHDSAEPRKAAAGRIANSALTAAFARFKQLADTRKSVTLFDVFEQEVPVS